MSNSTQNSFSDTMRSNTPEKAKIMSDAYDRGIEKAMKEGFAESEKDLKNKKTPFDKPTQNDNETLDSKFSIPNDELYTKQELDKAVADARREGHPTINGFCCACDYDIEFMKHDREFEIESLKKTCKHCGVIRGVKLHEDTDSHDRYQVGYNKAIDDVLATLRKEEV